MSEVIIIPNVNVELLNEQRLALVRVTSALEVKRPRGVRPEDVELLDGLLNMLDFWSDEHAGYHHAPQPPSNRSKK